MEFKKTKFNQDPTWVGDMEVIIMIRGAKVKGATLEDAHAALHESLFELEAIPEVDVVGVDVTKCEIDDTGGKVVYLRNE